MVRQEVRRRWGEQKRDRDKERCVGTGKRRAKKTHKKDTETSLRAWQ